VSTPPPTLAEAAWLAVSMLERTRHATDADRLAAANGLRAALATHDAQRATFEARAQAFLDERQMGGNDDDTASLAALLATVAGDGAEELRAERDRLRAELFAHGHLTDEQAQGLAEILVRHVAAVPHVYAVTDGGSPDGSGTGFDIWTSEPDAYKAITEAVEAECAAHVEYGHHINAHVRIDADGPDPRAKVYWRRAALAPAATSETGGGG